MVRRVHMPYRICIRMATMVMAAKEKKGKNQILKIW